MVICNTPEERAAYFAERLLALKLMDTPVVYQDASPMYKLKPKRKSKTPDQLSLSL